MSAPQPSGSFASTANGVYCAYCGSTPAARLDIRGHRGFVIMWIGWWGILSFVINPVTMLINLGARSTLTTLPPPIPGGPRVPMPPGKPLWHRVEFLLAIALIVLGPIVLLVLASLS